MDAFFHSAWAAKIIFIFAITNLILGVLVFFTCRCFPGINITKPFLHNHIYMRFYKFHCYLWLFFVISVLVHAVFALGFMGIPF
jgi:hypothetical protein